MVWQRSYNGAGNSDDEPSALIMAQSTNIYVTGSSALTASIEGYATIAYGVDGAPIWTNIFANPGGDAAYATAMAYDEPAGRLYVGGSVTLAYTFGGLPLWTNAFPFGGKAAALVVGASGRVFVGGAFGGMAAKFVTAAYSSEGIPMWTNVYDAGLFSVQFIKDLTIDDKENVFVTGWSRPPQESVYYFVTIGYTSSGAAMWTNRYSGTAGGISDPNKIIYDSAAGHLYVTGRSTGTGTGLDYATVAYSSTGDALWTNRYDGPGHDNDESLGIASDLETGNVYVTGYSFGGSGFDCATICYASDGRSIWTNRYPLAGGGPIILDRSHNVVIGAALSDNPATSEDASLLCYSPAGTLLWVAPRYDGPAHGYDNLQSVSLGTDGGIYATASSQGVHEGRTNYDYVTIKYVIAPDIVFRETSRLGSGSVRLTISAPTNTAFRLEATTNLLNWQTVTNFPAAPTNSWQYIDTAAPAIPSRYYRTSWSP
jgi:hypothetical protein